MARAVDVFGSWARSGRDERMANGHKDAVAHMLSYVSQHTQGPYRAIDAGCGNGWVVRLFQQMEGCHQALGVDGAEDMIAKAQRIDPRGEYVCADLLNWRPKETAEIIHSMEVLYYFHDPGALLKHIVANWLSSGGRFIAGVDHYAENVPSLNWAAENNIDFMTTLSVQQWEDCCRDAGLVDVSTWAFAPNDDWAGTLVMTGRKP